MDPTGAGIEQEGKGMLNGIDIVERLKLLACVSFAVLACFCSRGGGNWMFEEKE